MEGGKCWRVEQGWREERYKMEGKAQKRGRNSSVVEGKMGRKKEGTTKIN